MGKFVTFLDDALSGVRDFYLTSHRTGYTTLTPIWASPMARREEIRHRGADHSGPSRS